MVSLSTWRICVPKYRKVLIVQDIDGVQQVGLLLRRPASLVLSLNKVHFAGGLFDEMMSEPLRLLF